MTDLIVGVLIGALVGVPTGTIITAKAIEKSDIKHGIIRCGDCVFWKRHDKRCKLWNIGTRNDDYCSRGGEKSD